MFVNDYRPTKRVGIEELDGCIKLLSEAAEALREEGVMGYEQYEGAALALSLIRYGKFEYPHEFVGVFENKLAETY
jgi:hypothetical protein